MKPLWNKTVEVPRFEQLEGDLRTDVLVIGGGLAGLMCAYLLQQKGVNCTLVEGKRLGIGVTQNTTAKLTLQHGLIYTKLYRSNPEQARLYLEANRKALALYEKLCQSIDCDYEPQDAYLYTLRNPAPLEDEIKTLEKLGCPAEFVTDPALPFRTLGAAKIPGQAQFNPLKFVAGLCPGLRVYENTFVRRVEANTAYTKNGAIRAKHIVIATHFPFINTKGLYFVKMYQSRAYIITLEGAALVDGMYVDEQDDGFSLRSYQNLLFVCGGDHRTGRKGGGYTQLRSFAKAHYPGAREAAYWSNQDCMTLDGVPYIGRYAKSAPSLYVAAGFNKWGMTSAAVSGIIISELIANGGSDYVPAFSPQRPWLKPQLFLNVAETTMGLLTPTTKRCTHLGCGLRWNRREHSWDCPCHGSRFDADGSVLENPAMKKLKGVGGVDKR